MTFIITFNSLFRFCSSLIGVTDGQIIICKTTDTVHLFSLTEVFLLKHLGTIFQCLLKQKNELWELIVESY